MEINFKSLGNRKIYGYLAYFYRSIAIFLLLFFFQGNSLNAVSVSFQAAKISVYGENVQLRTVLDEIERESGYIFVYNSQVDAKRNVSVDIKGKTISEALDYLFTGSDIAYVIEGKHVVLNKKAVDNSKSVNQKWKVYGTVVDNEGLPIIGANILIVGSNVGTVTDVNGRFEIDVNSGDVISVSYLGYKNKEVKIGKQKEINIVLASDAELLDEVVVVGYGTQKKVNLTGAVSMVDSKSISNRPITNASQALQGVQGVYVNQGNGAQPGNDAATIRIRGMGSFSSAGNDPLILIDGIAGSLSDVNPQDIASISVLKDAASSAIYGSRAANGVILVTTKKAEAGKFSVQYNNSFGLQQITYLPDAVWDPILFMEGYNEAYMNEGNTEPFYSNALIEEYKAGMKVDNYTYPSTNWFDLLFRDGFMQEHNVRVTGGNDLMQMALSVGYLDQEGVMNYTDSKKLSVNFNGTLNYGKFKAGINLSGNYTNYNEPSYGVATYMQLAFRALPVMTAYNVDGSLGRSWLQTPGQNTFGNLLMEQYNRNNYKRTRMVSSIFAEYTFPYDIKFNATLGARMDYLFRHFYQGERRSYNPKTFEPQVMIPHTVAQYSSTYEIDPTVSYNLSWNRIFNEKHNVSALAGMNYEEFNDWSYGYKAQDGFFDDTLKEPGLGTEALNRSSSSSVVRLLSYFGRVNYSYADRYLFEVNFRYDGSSRFAKNNRWGFFPSFSAGWRIDQESFMEDARDWLSNLKLRASWGKLGNQSIGLYKYTPTLVSGVNYLFDNTLTQGYAVAQAVDSEISWEATSIANVALDFGFLNNSLSGSVEFFKKRTDGILRTINQPSQVGNYAGAVRNVGMVDNTGMEASLSYRNSIGGFNYNVYGNMTYVKNEVVNLGGDEIISGRRITKEGYPIDSYYVYDCIGIFQTQDEVDNHAFQSAQTAPGDLKFRDVNGNGVIDEDDRIVTGSSVPDFTYSFGLNLNYKGFGLNVFFQGVHGITTYPMHNLVQPYCNGAGVTYEWLEKAWRPNNTDGGYPRLLRSQTGHDNYEKANTFWLRDASYLRLKNVQLSYDFPKKWLKPVRINALKLFVNAENLLTFSDFDIFDPERTLTGNYLWGTYPSVKSFTGGLNVTF